MSAVKMRRLLAEAGRLVPTLATHEAEDLARLAADLTANLRVRHVQLWIAEKRK